MFKPVHNANGCLTSAVSSGAGLLALDSDTISALSAVLGLGGSDHTYLRIGEPPLCEVVRVSNVTMDGTVDAVRAQDGTSARAFSAGAPVEYVMTAQAVEDIVNATVSPNNVTVVAGDNITVSEGPEGTFTVSAVGANITSEGTIAVSGTYPNISIDVERGAFGCCG